MRLKVCDVFSENFSVSSCNESRTDTTLITTELNKNFSNNLQFTKLNLR